ncbi:MAG TPA: hypothetical protein VK476_00300, partial [Flavobacterium sp.]|nr:hypothetical protein [Flavobacterium sp.]
GIKDGSFKTGYAMDKVYKKKHFDINTIFAAFLNPKVDAFLKTASKGDMNYNCEITKNGIYFIEENMDAETFKLMKFDW